MLTAKIKTVIFVISVIFIFSSCSGTEAEKITAGYLTDTVYADDGTILMDVSVQYPVIAESKELSEKFKESAQNEFDGIIGTYRDEAEYMYENGLFHAMYEFITMYQALEYKDDIVSFVFTHYQYTGGAHPSTMQDSCTYNLKTGKLLQAEDIVGGTHEEVIAEAKRLFVEKINGSPDEYFENAADTVNEADDISYYINGNDGLVFYFNQYDIAPYAGGIKDVTMPIRE